MILFSVLLKIKNIASKEDFLRLVLEWNKSQRFEENIIRGVKWDSKMPFCFADEERRLQLKTLELGNIVAVRFEKRSADGAVWNTDYVLNLDEGRLAVQLDRGFVEGSLQKTLAYSAPFFISTLVKNDCLEPDCGLEIADTALQVGAEGHRVLTARDYSLPLVFVSASPDGNYQLDWKTLAWRTKGAAHIVVEKGCRSWPADGPAAEGAVAVWLPNGRSWSYSFGSATADELEGRIFEYINAQKPGLLYTWSGVAETVFEQRWKKKRRELEKTVQKVQELQEFEELCDSVGEDLAAVEEKNRQLWEENRQLRTENERLLQALQSQRWRLGAAGSGVVLSTGRETDLFADEIKELLLSVLGDNLPGLEKETRRRHVVEAVLAGNPSGGELKTRSEQIKNLLCGTKNIDSSTKNRLQQLGFQFSDCGSGHIRLTYYGDERYQNILSKTGSDWRGGLNEAAKIIKKVL